MNYAIIVAGGKGSRFSANLKKQFFKICSKTILDITCEKFIASKLIDKIILVLPEDEIKNYRKKSEKIFYIVKGGNERVYSLLNALKKIVTFVKPDDKIIVHDAVRPFFSLELLEKIVKYLGEYDCVIPVIDIEDTVKVVKNEFSLKTLDRKILKRSQTPQGFKGFFINKLIETIEKKENNFTDEASIFENLNIPVKTIKGEKRNIKITTKEDIMNYSFKVGFGYDIHKFTKNRKLILGGVEIEYEFGLYGHSDADVVIHAIIDAILGATGYGDIGEFFPDNDLKWKDSESTKLLKIILEKIEKNYLINNIDITIICEEPKLKNYKNKIRKNLAKILGLDEKDINIKAKTNEGLDATGEKKAISCFALVSLLKI